MALDDNTLLAMMQLKYDNARSGRWEIEIVDIDQQMLDGWYAHQEKLVRENGGIFERDMMRQTPEKDVPYLFYGKHYIMSGNHSMRELHLPFMRQVSGDVLLTGLGLGLVAAACLRRPAMNSVTVVECEKEVIRLVAPAVREVAEQAGKLLVIERHDAYRWSPRYGRQYDWIYHDIWSDLDATTIPDLHWRMMQWHKRWLKPGGMQTCFKLEDMQQFQEYARQTALSRAQARHPS